MLEIRVLNPKDEAVDAAAFLASLEWLYLTHRYPLATQGLVLRLLTLSGLEPEAWKQVVGQLAPRCQARHGLPPGQQAGEDERVWLKQALEDIWCYAAEVGLPMGEPPVCPAYLSSYGYTQTTYLTDLSLIYGHPAPRAYEQPWPEAACLPQNSFTQLGFLPQAVALMGMTAGAIERLIERGAQHDHRD